MVFRVHDIGRLIKNFKVALRRARFVGKEYGIKIQSELHITTKPTHQQSVQYINAAGQWHNSFSLQRILSLTPSQVNQPCKEKIIRNALFRLLCEAKVIRVQGKNISLTKGFHVLMVKARLRRARQEREKNGAEVHTVFRSSVDKKLVIQHYEVA